MNDPLKHLQWFFKNSFGAMLVSVCRTLGASVDDDILVRLSETCDQSAEQLERIFLDDSQSSGCLGLLALAVAARESAVRGVHFALSAALQKTFDGARVARLTARLIESARWNDNVVLALKHHIDRNDAAAVHMLRAALEHCAVDDACALCLAKHFPPAALSKDAFAQCLHLLVQKCSSYSVMPIWQACNEPGALGFTVLCRVSESLGAQRWRELLQQEAFWRGVFSAFESLHHNAPVALSKQIMFVFREALEACKAHAVTLNFPGLFCWDPKRAAQDLSDWDGWLLLYDGLEQYSMHLIEPLWPTFDKVAKGGAVPHIWLRLLMKKALAHDSVHVIRMVLVFFMQSANHAWLDDEFFCGPLLTSILLPALYRGVSGQVFPPLVKSFWERTFSDKDTRERLIHRLVPEMYPTNGKLHHNTQAVATLLDIIAESRIPCIKDQKTVGLLLLLGRAFYCIPVAWKLVNNCLADGVITSADQLFQRLRPHSMELIFEHLDAACALFAKARLTEQAVAPDAQNVEIFACYVACGGAKTLQKAPDEAVLAVLRRYGGGGLGFVHNLFPPEQQQKLSFDTSRPLSYALSVARNAFSSWKDRIVAAKHSLAQDSTCDAGLKWLLALTDPWWLQASGAGENKDFCALCESCVDELVRVASIPVAVDPSHDSYRALVLQRIERRSIVLETFRQLVGWNLVGDESRTRISKFGVDSLEDSTIEFEDLKSLFVCVAAASSSADSSLIALGKEQCLLVLKARFNQICDLDRKDAFALLEMWGGVAFSLAARQLEISPICLDMLIEVERKRDRFVGIAASVVEKHCVPTWKQFIAAAPKTLEPNAALINSEAEMVVSLAKQGFYRDESRRLDSEADEQTVRNVFSLARAFAVIYVEGCARSAFGRLVAAGVTLRLLRWAVANKRRLDRAKESERVQSQFSGSAAHLFGVRVWQMLCLSGGVMDDSVGAQVLDEMAAGIAELVHGFYLPSITVYIESFIVTFLSKFPQYVGRVLMTSLEDFSLKTAPAKILLGSVYVLVTRKLLRESNLVEGLVKRCLPFLNAVQNPVRNRVVFLCARLARENDIRALLASVTRAIVEMVADYNAKCGDLSRKVVKGEDDWLDDVIGNVSLYSLFFDVPIRAPEILSEMFIPQVLHKAWDAFEQRDRPVLRDIPALDQTHQQMIEEKHGAEMVRDIRETLSETLFFQRKAIPMMMLKLDEADHRQAVLESVERLPMIVCASLLDRAPNLGGLTRTCEVFGLQAVTMNDLTVMNTKDFQSVSVTAEKWIKCLHVPVEGLQEWLLHMKNEKGYALVGLEQCSDSVCIDDFQFQEKTILVLGNELRGMPAPYLSLLSSVVEIPQYGTIRSLNVASAASIMISQFVFQMKRKGRK